MNIKNLPVGARLYYEQLCIVFQTKMDKLIEFRNDPDTCQELATEVLDKLLPMYTNQSADFKIIDHIKFKISDPRLDLIRLKLVLELWLAHCIHQNQTGVKSVRSALKFLQENRNRKVAKRFEDVNNSFIDLISKLYNFMWWQVLNGNSLRETKRELVKIELKSAALKQYFTHLTIDSRTKHAIAFKIMDIIYTSSFTPVFMYNVGVLQNMVGIAYRDGSGRIVKSTAMALEWFKKAADNGVSDGSGSDGSGSDGSGSDVSGSDVSGSDVSGSDGSGDYKFQAHMVRNPFKFKAEMHLQQTIAKADKLLEKWLDHAHTTAHTTAQTNVLEELNEKMETDTAFLDYLKYHDFSGDPKLNFMRLEAIFEIRSTAKRLQRFQLRKLVDWLKNFMFRRLVYGESWKQMVLPLQELKELDVFQFQWMEKEMVEVCKVVLFIMSGLSTEYMHETGVYQNMYGIMFRDGKGVVQSPDLALTWFKRAADNGVAEAQYNVGILLESARFNEQYQRALKYFWLAAKQEYKDAILHLRTMVRVRLTTRNPEMKKACSTLMEKLETPDYQFLRKYMWGIESIGNHGAEPKPKLPIQLLAATYDYFTFDELLSLKTLRLEDRIDEIIAWRVEGMENNGIRVPHDCKTLADAVELVEWNTGKGKYAKYSDTFKGKRFSTIVVGKGQHQIDGKYLEIPSAMNIVGDKGVPREEIVINGGIEFEERIQGNCHLQHLTLQAKGHGVLGESSFTMDDVLVEQCGWQGVLARGTGVVGRCTDVEVRQCGLSGVYASHGGSITLIGAKTTVHHNCTTGHSNQYGLKVYGASTIQLVAPLTKEQVAIDNGGGGNWGAEYGDIHQIKTTGGENGEEKTTEQYKLRF